MLSPLQMLSYATGLCRAQTLEGGRLGFAPHLYHLPACDLGLHLLGKSVNSNHPLLSV